MEGSQSVSELYLVIKETELLLLILLLDAT